MTNDLYERCEHLLAILATRCASMSLSPCACKRSTYQNTES